MKTQEHTFHVELSLMTGGTGEDDYACSVEADEQLKDILREIEDRYNASVERYEATAVSEVNV